MVGSEREESGRIKEILRRGIPYHTFGEELGEGQRKVNPWNWTVKRTVTPFPERVSKVFEPRTETAGYDREPGKS